MAQQILDSPRKKETHQAYVLIRMPCKQVQAARNSFMSYSSLLRNYNGQVVGIGDEIKCIDGFWDDSKTLALLVFDSMFYANMWYNSTPAVKQPDWLDGVDIIAAPLIKSHIQNCQVCTVVDIHITDSPKFFSDYAPVARKTAEKLGIEGDVVRAKEGPEDGDYVVYRGGWRPRLLSINMWKSMEHFQSFMNDIDYMKIRPIREASSNSNSVLFNLGPLKSEPTYFIDEETKRKHKAMTGMK